MRLKKLKILSSFRGLPKGYEINFSEENENEQFINPICFIGLNGSGKSNILEVVSEVFYYLENYSRSNINGLDKYKTPFGFNIEYYIPKLTMDSSIFSLGELADYTIDDLDKDVLITIEKKINETPLVKASFGDYKKKINKSKYQDLLGLLPKNILGYSSGMNELLSNPFIKMDFDYLKEVKQKSNESLRATLNLNRLFYLNYNSSKLVTICNFIFNSKKVLPIKKELKIDKLGSFSINIKYWKQKVKKDYFPSELNQAIFSFEKIDPLFDKTENSSYKNKDTIEYQFNFNLTDAVIEAFVNEFKTSNDLFRILYNFQILNLELVGEKTARKVRDTNAKSGDNLSDLIPRFEKDKLIFSVNNIAFKKYKVKDLVYFKQLSDGEHQLLQILGSIALFDNKSTLFLLDEPTTHFNPEWRSKFIYLMNACVGEEKREQEILLTTHSPFIVSDCKKENVIQTLNNDEKKYQIPETETYGSSIRYLLSRLFNQKNSIGEYSYRDLEILSEKIHSIKNPDDIEDIKLESLKFGDSPEKMMMFHLLNEKIKTLK